jgi:[ribosomal protein S18]-alanine N-acetyltransferase
VRGCFRTRPVRTEPILLNGFGVAGAGLDRRLIRVESSDLDIARLTSASDAQVCAELMASSEPWLTLGRSYQESLRIVKDPTREVYVGRDKEGFAGFLIVCMTGALVGYVQTILVHPARRGRGIGSRLLRFAEERIQQESPNVFMCVSSFNHDAARLYARLGYKVVGELTDYIVPGFAEILLRKSTGPLTGFSPGKADSGGNEQRDEL